MYDLQISLLLLICVSGVSPDRRPVPHSEESVNPEQRAANDGHTSDNVHTTDQRVRLSLLIFPIHPPQIFNDVK